MFSKIVSWEVWNFMSIEHAKCEFDEKNIVNLKGYNDSGKSAMLSALKVLLTNSNATKQTDFIQDDKEYFRILATFDDGVQILRDKYINGQSLYEMYKDGVCIYSTKSESGSLMKVAEVPEPIAAYLGLINYEKTYLNARSCFEKQIGVQTTGSENYKMFNTFLKSEEIASAAALLNNDKNKLVNDINTIDADIRANQSLLGVGQFLSKEMMDYLKEHNSVIDDCETKLDSCGEVTDLLQKSSSIVITPKLDSIDLSDLTVLSNIADAKTALGKIKISPEMPVVDMEQLQVISNLKDTLSKAGIEIPVEVPKIDDSAFKELDNIKKLYATLKGYDETISYCSERLSQIDIKLKEVEEEAHSANAGLIKCPICGGVFRHEENV